MKSQRLRPPRSSLARSIARTNRARREKGAKRRRSDERYFHPGRSYPDLWDICVDALDQLHEAAGPEAAAASIVLEAMLKRSVPSEILVFALRDYKLLSADPIAGARAKRGDSSRQAERRRIEEAHDELVQLPDRVLWLGDDLKLAVLSIETRDGAPTGAEIRTATQTAWLQVKQALQPLLDLAAKAEQAAPASRGRLPEIRVRARLKLVASCYSSYALVQQGPPDESFWTLFRALWEALTGEQALPEEQRLREHVRDRLARVAERKG